MKTKELQKLVEETGFRIYQGTLEDDIAMTQLWYRLQETGDINTIFPAKDSQTVSSFFNVLQKARGVCYAEDDGVWAFAFAEPFTARAVSFSLWLDEDKRHTRKAFRFSQIAYTLAMDLYPMLFGITREELVEEHEKVGYRKVGQIPGLVREDINSQLVVLDQEGFRDSVLNLNRGEAV